MRKIKIMTVLVFLLLATMTMLGFTYAQQNSVYDTSMTQADYLAEQFVQNYYEQGLNNLEDLEPFSSGIGASWFNDVGTGPLPRRPSYGRYVFDFLPGDIIHEESGMPGLGGTQLAGHTLMVEGRFRCPNYGYFWRVIESGVRQKGGPGVSRSVMDDERFRDLRGHVLRVHHASDYQRQQAVNFAIAQYGKPWAIQLGSAPLQSDAWMCSTLVWAAWMSVGVSIAIPNFNGGVLPLNIFNAMTPLLSHPQRDQLFFNTTDLTNYNIQINSPRHYGSWPNYWLPLEFPRYIGNRRVTRIAANAFNGCDEIREHIIPNTVTYIGSGAFANTPRLSRLSFEDYGLIAVSNSMFENSNVSHVFLPNGLQTIGSNPFRGSNVMNLHIPSTVTTIGSSAFANSRLLNIDIPNSVNRIDFNAFLNTNMTVNILPGRSHIQANLFMSTGLRNVVIPDSVTTIGASAFANTSLRNVVIPDSVTEIGNSAFWDIPTLTSITLPFIGQRRNGTGATHFGWIFGSCPVWGVCCCTMPPHLWSVTITGNSTIRANAFRWFDRLIGINLQQLPTSFETNAFYGTNARVYLPNNISHIPANLLGHAGIRNLVIPNNVQSIAFGALAGASSLQSLNIPFVGANLSGGGVGRNHFGYIFGAPNWNVQNNFIPSSLQSVRVLDGMIAAGAFANTPHLRSVNMPHNITAIGASAFRGSGITRIDIPAGVTRILEMAFMHTSNLRTVNFPHNSNLGTIHASAFLFSRVEELWVPDSVSYIGTMAFAYTSLRELHFGANSQLSTINEAAFMYANLRDVVIPDNVSYIGFNAFYGSYALESITLPFTGNGAFCCGSVTHFGWIFGASCWSNQQDRVPTSLRSVTITGGDMISNNAFRNLHRIQYIHLPDTIEIIGYSAFRNSGILSITIPESVKFIRGYAFANNANLRVVNILKAIDCCCYAVRLASANVFLNTPNLSAIFVPDLYSLQEYIEMNHWGQFSDLFRSWLFKYESEITTHLEVNVGNVNAVRLEMGFYCSRFLGHFWQGGASKVVTFGMQGYFDYLISVSMWSGSITRLWIDFTSSNLQVQISSTGWCVSMRVRVYVEKLLPPLGSKLLFEGVVHRWSNTVTFELWDNCSYFSDRYFHIVINESDIFSFSAVSQFNTANSQGCGVSLYIGNNSWLSFYICHDNPQGIISIHSSLTFSWWAIVQIWLLPEEPPPAKELLFEDTLTRDNHTMNIDLLGNSSFFSGRYFKIVIHDSNAFNITTYISTFTTGSSAGASVVKYLGEDNRLWFNVCSSNSQGSVQITSPFNFNWFASVQVWLLPDGYADQLFHGHMQPFTECCRSVSFETPGNSSYLFHRQLLISITGCFNFSGVVSFISGGSSYIFTDYIHLNSSTLMRVTVSHFSPTGTFTIYDSGSWQVTVQIWLLP